MSKEIYKRLKKTNNLLDSTKSKLGKIKPKKIGPRDWCKEAANEISLALG